MEERRTPEAVPKNRNGGKPEDESEKIYAAIAERVRADSLERASLTSREAVACLVPDRARIQFHIGGMARSEAYQDIKLLVAANGVIYLYSEKGIARKEAERLAYDEEVRGQIAARVRADSGKLFKLTPLAILGATIPGAEPDRVDNHLASILADERYKDIHLVAGGKGRSYMYSERGMTANYAELLARGDGTDPIAKIADTVREDSRVYPRPTRLQIFSVPIFSIDSNELDRYAGELATRPEYGDIKLVRASTGAVYLYSDLYLDPEWVKTTVEWEEVGRYQNP